MMRDQKDIERAIAHFVDAARGAAVARDADRLMSFNGIIRALKWVLGEEGDFSVLLKALDSVGPPPPLPPRGGPN